MTTIILSHDMTRDEINAAADAQIEASWERQIGTEQLARARASTAVAGRPSQSTADDAADLAALVDAVAAPLVDDGSVWA